MSTPGKEPKKCRDLFVEFTRRKLRKPREQQGVQSKELRINKQTKSTISSAHATHQQQTTIYYVDDESDCIPKKKVNRFLWENVLNFLDSVMCLSSRPSPSKKQWVGGVCNAPHLHQVVPDQTSEEEERPHKKTP